MIKAETVLVLGAGASAPFGFPTGQGLKDQICNDTLSLSNATSVSVLNKLGFDTNEMTRFRTALLNSGRPSVDAFLEYRGDFIDIGKIAIATALLPYERTCGLFEDWSLKRTKPNHFKESNWYDLLFGVLADGVPFDELDKNKLSIITFNYDRSIEQYLFTCLKNSYNKTDQDCAEKLRKMNVIHVHGSLGPLNWQLRPVGLSSVPYDSGIEPNIVKLAAENIKIIHESIADTPEFLQARKLMLRAAQVFFLGFGYHPANLKRLGIGTLEMKHRKVMGTSYGLSYERKKNIGWLFPGLIERINTLVPKDVYTFLHDYVSFGEL
jgi:hypothetical protein